MTVDETPCTDCGGTGVTYQTERPCACQVTARPLSAPQQVFAQRLAVARAGLEMSQEELSRRSGLPASSISHYESGRRGPSIDSLVRIIRAMPGLNANWLLGIAGGEVTDEYEDGYSDALRDAQEALTALEQRMSASTQTRPEGEAWKAYGEWFDSVSALLDGDTDEVDAQTWTDWYAKDMPPASAAARYRKFHAHSEAPQEGVSAPLVLDFSASQSPPCTNGAPDPVLTLPPHSGGEALAYFEAFVKRKDEVNRMGYGLRAEEWPEFVSVIRAALTDHVGGRGLSETYRNWHIHYDPPPIPTRNCDWHFAHDDFDGAPDTNDNRCGHAESLEAAKAEIDAWIEDNFDCRCSAAIPADCMALTCKWRAL